MRAAFLAVALFAAPAAAQIGCGTPEDQALISDCQLKSRSPEAAAQCFGDVVARLDPALAKIYADFEVHIRGLEPGTTEAYDRRLATLDKAHQTFLQSRGPICGADGIILRQFEACCQVRATRRYIDDLTAILRWN